MVEAADVAVVVPEHRPGRRVHHQPGALDDGQLDPARHQDAAEVAVPDEDDVAVGQGRRDVGDQVVGPPADLLGRLAPGAPFSQIDQPGWSARI